MSFQETLWVQLSRINGGTFGWFPKFFLKGLKPIVPGKFFLLPFPKKKKKNPQIGPGKKNNPFITKEHIFVGGKYPPFFFF